MNISQHIIKLRKQFLDDEHYNDIKDINWGSCFDFAYDLCKALENDGIKGSKIKQVKGMHGHSWVELNGKHYDAEHPDGVSSPNELNFFKRKEAMKEHRPKKTLKQLREEWQLAEEKGYVKTVQYRGKIHHGAHEDIHHWDIISKLMRKHSLSEKDADRAIETGTMKLGKKNWLTGEYHWETLRD